MSFRIDIDAIVEYPGSFKRVLFLLMALTACGSSAGTSKSLAVRNCITYWKSSIRHPKHVDVRLQVVIESFHFTRLFHQLSLF